MGKYGDNRRCVTACCRVDGDNGTQQRNRRRGFRRHVRATEARVSTKWSTGNTSGGTRVRTVAFVVFSFARLSVCCNSESESESERENEREGVCEREREVREW